MQIDVEIGNPSDHTRISHRSFRWEMDNASGKDVNEEKEEEEEGREGTHSCVQRLSFKCAVRLLFGAPKRASKSGNLNISPIKLWTLFYIGEDGVINRMRSTRFISTVNHPCCIRRNVI